VVSTTPPALHLNTHSNSHILLKLWVSFAKEPYKRDYILQKRPIIVFQALHLNTQMSTPVQQRGDRTKYRYICIYIYVCIYIDIYVYTCVSLVEGPRIGVILTVTFY